MTTASLNLNDLGRAARAAARQLALLTTDHKNRALLAIADSLSAHAEPILSANAEDLSEGRRIGMSDALLDRLRLDASRLSVLARDTRRIAELPDPVGEEIDRRTLPNGMELIRRRVPIGVLGVIYEARPNVTVDIAALSLKTGNAVILRGGSETLRSNRALIDAIHAGLTEAVVPLEAISFLDSPDRALVRDLLRLDRYVDMIIPRGGESLHRLCREESTIPVITGGIGICHIFVDASAHLDKSVDIVENAKVQRPSVCNALDTLLVHRDIAAQFLPLIVARLARHGVEIRATKQALPFLPTLESDRIIEAGPDDFDQEWLGLILGIDVVDNLDAAIEHIQTHSTEHSDSILTCDEEHADLFTRRVNSAAVYVNASTRFTDGGQFGLGAEVAVSTQKLHARGPMGLTELTTYKWIGRGDWIVRAG